MKSLFFKSILLVVFLAVAVLANAQIKYYSNGKLTMAIPNLIHFIIRRLVETEYI